MNDDESIAAVGAGDQMALQTLFERHLPWIAGRLRRTPPVDDELAAIYQRGPKMMRDETMVQA
jgi:hypothetical protein